MRTHPQRPHARTPAHTQLALLSALPPGRLNPHAHAPAHAHPQLRQGTPRRPDGPNRSAALPKSPFGRRARGFFFFFAVSSLLCFLLYPLFFENIRRPPLASKFVGRPLRTPLAAPRLPASLPSAPLVPRPAPSPHPAPPRSPPRPFPPPHSHAFFTPGAQKGRTHRFRCVRPFFLSVQNPVPCPARSSAGLFPGLKTGVSRSRRRCRARNWPA